MISTQTANSFLYFPISLFYFPATDFPKLNQEPWKEEHGEDEALAKGKDKDKALATGKDKDEAKGEPHRLSTSSSLSSQEDLDLCPLKHY